ncbi:MAG: hypothetical protein ACREFI_05655 [Stellaceae bacterium]
MTANNCSRALLALACVVAITPAARAQMTGSPTPGYKLDPATPASATPAPLREIGFDQNLNQHVPLDTTFRDE